MKLKAGIIGLGVGESHILGYEKHETCFVKSLCDLSDEKIAMAKGKYPEKIITKNPNEILDDPEIDIVSIASYDNYHYEQIIRALDNNKHIFVEKPLCLYKHEAKHIREVLDAKPHLRLGSNLILRKSPRFCRLKELIESGDMGSLYFLEGGYNYGRIHKITEGWRGQIDFYSVVFGGGIHIIDLFLWLTGDKIIEVDAYGTNISTKGTNYKYNDMVVSILKFESGVVGKLSANYSCVYPHFHEMSVYGTKATFVNGLEHGKLYQSRDENTPVSKMSEAYPGVHKGDLIHSFVGEVIKNGEAEITKDEVFDAMSVCLAIEEASNKIGPVKVEYI